MGVNYLFIFPPGYVALCASKARKRLGSECFLVFGNFSLFKTPFPGWSSIPTSFVSFFVFYIFSYLLLKTMGCFSGFLIPLPAFRSCFVEFTQCLNVLLMNLWGRKWSPHPIPPPSSVFWHHLLKECLSFSLFPTSLKPDFTKFLEGTQYEYGCLY